jgi:hypothetical protein
MPSSPYSNLSPAGTQLLGLGGLPSAQPADPNETDEQRRKRLMQRRQQSVSPATRMLLGGAGFGGGY